MHIFSCDVYTESGQFLILWHGFGSALGTAFFTMSIRQNQYFNNQYLSHRWNNLILWQMCSQTTEHWDMLCSQWFNIPLPYWLVVFQYGLLVSKHFFQVEHWINGQVKNHLFSCFLGQHPHLNATCDTNRWRLITPNTQILWKDMGSEDIVWHFGQHPHLNTTVYSLMLFVNDVLSGVW